MLQNSGKHQPDLLMDNGCDIVRRQVISGSKAFCPVCMGSGQWVGTQVAAAEGDGIAGATAIQLAPIAEGLKAGVVRSKEVELRGAGGLQCLLLVWY